MLRIKTKWLNIVVILQKFLPWGRALHCMDLCFEFGTKEGYTELTGDPDKMSDDLIAQAQSMVYSFAKTGNPNNDLISEWKAYDDNTKYNMVSNR